MRHLIFRKLTITAGSSITNLIGWNTGNSRKGAEAMVKNVSKTEQEQKWLTTLAAAFTQVNDTEAMMQFIDEIFTPAERHNIALRWRLMQMLREGVSQRLIAEELGISLCKITRGSKILKSSGSITSKLLNSEKKDPLK